MVKKIPQRLLGYCWGCYKVRIQTVQQRVVYAEEYIAETPLTKGFKSSLPNDYWCKCKRCGHRNFIRKGVYL